MDKKTETTAAAVVTTTTVIYWDASDPQNVGWAYRARGTGGYVESDSIDGLAADCCDALRDGVQPPMGSWDALMAELADYSRGGEILFLGAEGDCGISLVEAS